MTPNSVINSICVAHLSEADYSRVATYLRDAKPKGRRSYAPYIGSVFQLDDTAQAVTFQDERLLPIDDRGRPRILLLFNNAHPESIRNGMFHTAESGVAALDRSPSGSPLLGRSPHSEFPGESQRLVLKRCVRRPVLHWACVLLDLPDVSPKAPPGAVPARDGTAWISGYGHKVPAAGERLEAAGGHQSQRRRFRVPHGQGDSARALEGR
jgi:hypothetical protein